MLDLNGFSAPVLFRQNLGMRVHRKHDVALLNFLALLQKSSHHVHVMIDVTNSKFRATGCVFRKKNPKKTAVSFQLKQLSPFHFGSRHSDCLAPQLLVWALLIPRQGPGAETLPNNRTLFFHFLSQN